MKKSVLFILVLFNVNLLVAQENDIPPLTWPRDLITGSDTVTLYQPQLESFNNNIIEGRMAISLKQPGKEMMFGAVWFKANVSTDLEERLVELEEMNIVQTSFPDVDKDKADKFIAELETTIEGSTEVMSLDRLLASLEDVEKEKDLSAQFNNDPPQIFYRNSPAVLMIVDGDPIFKDTDDSNIQYVVNTPYFIVKDVKNDQLYIKGGDFWYSSKQISSDWVNVTRAPKDIEKLAEKVILKDSVMSDSLLAELDEPPAIIVATKSAELILVDGDPDYKTIEGTSLLYVLNTESDIGMDINTQLHYVLLSGRWFTSKTLKDGDWKFVEPDDLPPDFSKIPADSDMGNVLSSVPGTEEARAAVLEQSIPQTATVDRKTATVEVSFDGDPEFKKIDGAKVSYAENSDKTVLLIDKKYYCVDDGIWFESEKATGPYVVCVNRPDEVDDIPPESPVYNVKYVYIYDSTPEVVYVGYTPGYTCSYVYGGVVVYGTGYYYYPWYRTYYYPRPVTWGFHVHYNPWTGWGFSYGMSWGWFSVGFHGGYHGWWGPRGYRYGYRHGYHRGYRHGYRHGYNHGMRAGYRAGYRAGRNSNNVYRNRGNGVKSTGLNSRQSQANMGRNRAGGGNTRNQTGARTQPSNRQNNVYAGKDGNVYKRDNNGNVQQRNNGQWNSGSGASSRDRTSNQQQVNSQAQSRQQGNKQYNNYNSSRSRSNSSYNRSSSGSRGGGSRGGGGRRR